MEIMGSLAALFAPEAGTTFNRWSSEVVPWAMLDFFLTCNIAYLKWRNPGIKTARTYSTPRYMRALYRIFETTLTGFQKSWDKIMFDPLLMFSRPS